MESLRTTGKQVEHTESFICTTGLWWIISTWTVFGKLPYIWISVRSRVEKDDIMTKNESILGWLSCFKPEEYHCKFL